MSTQKEEKIPRKNYKRKIQTKQTLQKVLDRIHKIYTTKDQKPFLDSIGCKEKDQNKLPKQKKHDRLLYMFNGNIIK